VSSSAERGDAGASPRDLGLDPALERDGLNLAAVLSPRDYDGRVPEPWRTAVQLPDARSVVILASGGDAFFSAAMAHAAGRDHPLDRFCEERVQAEADRWTREGAPTRAFFYWQRLPRAGESGPGEFLDFVSVAEAAGLGVRSRLGQLIHPRYGLWFGLRALLLSRRALPRSPTVADDFAPCTPCPAPCASACPGAAVSTRGTVPHPDSAFSSRRCAGERQANPACEARCDARLACPVGATWAYSAQALAHHMQSRLYEGEKNARPQGGDASREA
jgi:epoxyqueuosine reductase